MATNDQTTERLRTEVFLLRRKKRETPGQDGYLLVGFNLFQNFPGSQHDHFRMEKINLHLRTLSLKIKAGDFADFNAV